VRGNGGYVIAPPSRWPDGREYGIEEPLDFFRFAEAPEWLYDLILPKSISQRATSTSGKATSRVTKRGDCFLRPEGDAASITVKSDLLSIAHLKGEHSD
jgi:hypothetical protein